MANVPSLPLYTETLSAALDAVREHFQARGFAFNEDWCAMGCPFMTGGIPYETEKRGTYRLTRMVRGKDKDFYLQVAIYRMQSGRYELVAYVG